MPTREIQRVTNRAKKRGFDGTGTFKDEYFLNGKPTGRPKKIRPPLLGTEGEHGETNGGVEMDANGEDETHEEDDHPMALDPNLMGHLPVSRDDRMGLSVAYENDGLL